jgi:hypothetical protein
MSEFLKRAFSENELPNAPSASRLIMGVSTLFACGWITHIVWHSHALPDVMSMGGLVAFSTAAYTVGKINQSLKQ